MTESQWMGLRRTKQAAATPVMTEVHGLVLVYLQAQNGGVARVFVVVHYMAAAQRHTVVCLWAQHVRGDALHIHSRATPHPSPKQDQHCASNTRRAAQGRKPHPLSALGVLRTPWRGLLILLFHTQPHRTTQGQEELNTGTPEGVLHAIPDIKYAYAVGHAQTLDARSRACCNMLR